MEDRSQSMPVEQANQVDKMKQVGAMVAWQENELWEDPKVIANSIVVGCTVATLNQHRTRLAAEGSTTEILFRNVSKKKVHLLSNVIRSTLSPQEKLHADK
ncbi:hypothetical protein V6N12_029902 [Hibiscus sabdariffa]|uniref:Uncharacterized protein n=1 Tax=Hibiscus sabdariffa TaxID=183260 RepID=A0ABR2CXJ5_9ROSI